MANITQEDIGNLTQAQLAAIGFGPTGPELVPFPDTNGGPKSPRRETDSPEYLKWKAKWEQEQLMKQGEKGTKLNMGPPLTKVPSFIGGADNTPPERINRVAPPDQATLYAAALALANLAQPPGPNVIQPDPQNVIGAPQGVAPQLPILSLADVVEDVPAAVVEEDAAERAERSVTP